MQAIRIKLKQRQAHYGKPECVDNRMTYPLPPYSTVIGALHGACGYTEYHPMDVSIQGKFDSMQKEVYTNQILLNSRQDDRGILIYLQNPDLFTAGYEVVAKAVNNQGNSFRKNITIDIVSQQKLQDYWALLDQKDALDEELKSLKERIKAWKKEEKAEKEKLKSLDKKSEEYQAKLAELNAQKQQWNEMEKDLKEKKLNQCDMPLAHYRTLTKGPKYVEVLYNVELLLHIRAAEEVLEDIENSIHNLTCIGRSEDFVELVEIKRVEVSDQIDQEYSNNQYAGYIQRDLLVKSFVGDAADYDYSVGLEAGRGKYNEIPVRGTMYFLPKNYQLTANGREFEYKWVYYVSKYNIDEESTGIYVDEDKYIVDFV